MNSKWVKRQYQRQRQIQSCYKVKRGGGGGRACNQMLHTRFFHWHLSTYTDCCWYREAPEYVCVSDFCSCIMLVPFLVWHLPQSTEIKKAKATLIRAKLFLQTDELGGGGGGGGGFRASTDEWILWKKHLLLNGAWQGCHKNGIYCYYFKRSRHNYGRLCSEIFYLSIWLWILDPSRRNLAHIVCSEYQSHIDSVLHVGLKKTFDNIFFSDFTAVGHICQVQKM